MKVELLTCTPDFLKVIWCAARTCYSPKSPLELWQEDPPREEMLRLAKRIIEAGHHSILEHCAMTFAVEGVSRACLAQYSRHRIGVSLSVQSQRAVYVSPGNVVFPRSVLLNEEAKRVFEESARMANEAYMVLVSLGVKKEDARFLLPEGTRTNFVTSLNLRSLLDVYTKRVLTPGAQWEIKEMLKEMARLVVAREPWLAPYFKLEEK